MPKPRSCCSWRETRWSIWISWRTSWSSRSRSSRTTWSGKRSSGWTWTRPKSGWRATWSRRMRRWRRWRPWGSRRRSCWPRRRRTWTSWLPRMRKVTVRTWVCSGGWRRCRASVFLIVYWIKLSNFKNKIYRRSITNQKKELFSPANSKVKIVCKRENKKIT